jgi:hypothetical protein
MQTPTAPDAPMPAPDHPTKQKSPVQRQGYENLLERTSLPSCVETLKFLTKAFDLAFLNRGSQLRDSTGLLANRQPPVSIFRIIHPGIMRPGFSNSDAKELQISYHQSP